MHTPKINTALRPKITNVAEMPNLEIMCKIFEVYRICNLGRMERRSRKRSSSAGSEKMERFSLLHRACCFDYFFNPLNPELNPICYFLALLGAHHFLHVSRIRVNIPNHAPIIYTLKSTKFTLTL